MSATLFIIAAVAAVTNAGFIGGPAVVAPAFARISAPAYYTYHAPLAYHTAVTATAAPAVKADAPAATKEPAAAAPAEPAAAPSKDSEAEEDEPEYDPNPSYSFSYDIKDAETGDTKTQSESLENGVVKGSYTVVDPDGVKRTVEYTADAVNGFNAVVNTEPSDVVIKQPVSKTTPAPATGAAAPTAAPAKPAFPAAFFHAYSTPLAYHAAVAKIIPAPVTKLVSSPVSYGTSHIYHPSSITYAATPVHHKVIYA